MVGEDHEHSMSLPLLVDDGCHPQGAVRQPGLDQQLAFQKLNVFAVTEPVIGIVPPVENTPMILVCDGKD
jgi:hypothetical protein